MAKYYIGGVANVSAFTGTSGAAPQHLFDAKTLTDSSINVSVSAEEIRGGEGAQLLGKFFHTTVFNLSLTDALFDLNYIAKQVGADVDADGESVTMKSIKATASSGTATFTLGQGEEVSSLDFGSMYSTGLICWDANGNTYALSHTAGTTTYTFTVGAGVSEICVTVPVSKSGRQITVNAMYQPGVMSLIMRAKLFEGDACKASDGQAVGELVIEIPKFQLDGTIDLAMAMTSPATYALNGSALANGCGCGDTAWYAKITEVILGTSGDKYTGYTGIVVDADNLTVGDTLGVYAFAVGKAPKRLLVSEYSVTGAGTINTAGVITGAGQATITVSLTGSAITDESVSATFTAAE